MTFPERLRQRAASRGIYMQPHEIRDMAEHFKILMRWNETVHLTSVQDEGAILDRHFLESLEALKFLQEKQGGFDLVEERGLAAALLGDQLDHLRIGVHEQQLYGDPLQYFFLEQLPAGCRN